MKTNIKKLSLIALCNIFIGNYSIAQAPKLYITLVSHNEDNIGYDNSSTLYYNNRNALVNICNTLQTKGVKYNYGGDWVALEAIAALDTGDIVSTTSRCSLFDVSIRNYSFQYNEWISI